MPHPTDHELENVRRDDADVANERKAPVTSLPDRRIRRLADLRDWLDKGRVINALEETGDGE